MFLFSNCLLKFSQGKVVVILVVHNATLEITLDKKISFPYSLLRIAPNIIHCGFYRRGFSHSLR